MNKLSSSLQSFKDQLNNIVEGDIFIPEQPLSQKFPFTTKSSPKNRHENRWRELHNSEFIIRDEFSPFPLYGAAAVVSDKFYQDNKGDEKDGADHLYILGGKQSTSFGGHSSMEHLYHVKDIDWSSLVLRSASASDDDPFGLNQSKSKESQIPRSRAYHSLTKVLSDKCILYGGLVDNQSAIFSSGNKFDPCVYELDLHNKNWTKIVPTSETCYRDSLEMQFPRARAYHSACSLGDGNVFIFGGLAEVSTSSWSLKTSFEVLSDLWLFNSTTRSWKLISSPETNNQKFRYHPSARSHHCMVASPKTNKLYIIGGCTLNGQPFKEIIQYDVAKDEWSICGIIPTSLDRTSKVQGVFHIPFLIPGRFGAAAIFDDFIFIVGGETLVTDEKGVGPILDDILIFSIQNNLLIKGGVPSWKSTISHHTLAICNSRLLVIGGKHSSSVLPSQTNLVKQIPLYYTFDRLSYGKPLQSISDPISKCPAIIHLCVEYLMSEVTETVGLFSIKSSPHDILRFRLHFELGNVTSHDFIKQVLDPHIVATAMLDFLNTIPTALLSDQYREIIDTMVKYESTLSELLEHEHEDDSLEQNEESLLQQFREIIFKLPIEQQTVLLLILKPMHLAVVTDENPDVSLKKLAQSITHTLLRAHNPTQYSVKDDWADRNGLRIANRVIMKLIEKEPLLQKDC